MIPASDPKKQGAQFFQMDCEDWLDVPSQTEGEEEDEERADEETKRLEKQDGKP